MGGKGLIYYGVIRLSIFILVGFLLVMGFANQAHSATNLNGYPSGAGGLMSFTNSPYIVTGDIQVKNGDTLTIEPGVIVKMQSNRSIILTNGKVIIGSATSTSPVIITSCHDDSYAGDTNANGTSTSPSVGDWKKIQASSANSQITVNNTIVRYGGFNSGVFELLSGAQATIASTTIEYSNNDGITLRNGDTSLALSDSTISNTYDALTIAFQANATVASSTFTSNRRGIAIDSDADVANLVISGNTFSGNDWVVGMPAPAGISFDDSDDELDARNNSWGDASGPTIASNPDGTGDAIIGDVLYDPWSDKPTRIPVILVPGIMGTELKKGDELLWSDIVRMVTSPSDDFMDQLSMNEDGTPLYADVVVDDVVRKKELISVLPDSWGFDYFYSLIQNFMDAGYEESTDLFVFPYDWRFGIQINTQSLKEKINSVLLQTNNQKVNVVAHSMGGLITKQYLLDNSTSTINKITFVGTPHLGSPKATKTILFGDNLGVELAIPFLNTDEVKKISKNMLSIYQLLPSEQYITDIGKYFYDLTQQTSFTHQEVNDYLINEGLNSSHLQSAIDFHSNDLDDFNISGISAYNIIGCDTATLGKIIIQNQELVETEYGIEFVAGDGTVPFGSADAINVSSTNTFYAKGVEHATMPSQSSIKQLITQIITDSVDISSLSDITQDINDCVFNGQVVSVFSPVDLHIYDSSGNHVGPDANGDIELNIAGATYEQIGEDKFIFLPNVSGVSYDVQLDATDSGTFSLKVAKVENSEVTETAYYNDIAITDASQATVTLATSTSDTILQVDESGSGTYEQVSIDAVLDSTQSADVTKPTTLITISGSNTSSTTYQNSATISLSATDDNAGVLKTEYSLDNSATWNTYSNSFIINTIGDTTIMYRSTDNAGNTEASNSQTISIVYAGSVIIISPTPTASIDSNTSESEPEVIDQKVLGEQIERPSNEQYTKTEILMALSLADIDTLLDYLGKSRDKVLEQNIVLQHSQSLGLDQPATNFIVYGTKSTTKLGTGERAGVLHSYKEAFNKMPESEVEWDDVINIATNKFPNIRNTEAEKSVYSIFEEVYNRSVNMSDKDDYTSVMVITYGLRPIDRSVENEKQGIKTFIEVYDRLPISTLDWNILRDIVY